jgi:hypothetical protein
MRGGNVKAMVSRSISETITGTAYSSGCFANEVNRVPGPHVYGSFPGVKSSPFIFGFSWCKVKSFHIWLFLV